MSFKVFEFYSFETISRIWLRYKHRGVIKNSKTKKERKKQTIVGRAITQKIGDSATNDVVSEKLDLAFTGSFLYYADSGRIWMDLCRTRRLTSLDIWRPKRLNTRAWRQKPLFCSVDSKRGIAFPGARRQQITIK